MKGLVNFEIFGVLGQKKYRFVSKNSAWENSFFAYPTAKIINFPFFRKSHERSLNSCNESFFSKHCTIRAVIGMASMIHH